MTAQRRGAAALVLLCLIGCGEATTTTPERAEEDAIDRAVLRSMADRKIPALALLIRKDGKVIKQKAYGDASLSPEIAATEHTRFPLFSITKTFTAVGVMKLVEDGKLKLDESAGSILDDLPESWRGVTIRQLLDHTSGLPDIVVLSADSAAYLAPTREEALKKAYELPLRARAGEESAYIQTGYVLLGLIVEKRSGLAFHTFMEETFFRPLGMSETAYANFSAPLPERAKLYEVGRYLPVAGALRRVALERPTLHESWDNPDYNNVGATLNTSIADLAKWDAALGDGRILKPVTLKRMWTVAPVSRRTRGAVSEGYGGGWIIREGAGPTTARYTGGDAAVYDHVIDNSLTIAVLTNAMYAGIEEVEATIRSACLSTP